MYASGKSLKEIMEVTGITSTTIEGWYERYKWADKRKEFREKLSKTLYKKFITKSEQIIERVLEVVRHMMFEPEDYCVTISDK